MDIQTDNYYDNHYDDYYYDDFPSICACCCPRGRASLFISYGHEKIILTLCGEELVQYMMFYSFDGLKRKIVEIAYENGSSKELIDRMINDVDRLPYMP